MFRDEPLFPSTWWVDKSSVVFWEFTPAGEINEYHNYKLHIKIGHYTYFENEHRLLIESRLNFGSPVKPCV